MNIKIHRGLNQIGGCITEISTDSTRVFIDIGQNLPGLGIQSNPDEDKQMVESLFNQNKKDNEAVFYTHAHEDHVGLFSYVPKYVSQYIGDGAKEILIAKYNLIKKGFELDRNDCNALLKNTENELHINAVEKIDNEIAEVNRKIRILKSFRTWKRTKPHALPESIEIGDIRITPFFNCHSIYDSYMFLIEADGKRIWHTGDFREHGYLGKGLFPTLEHYATDIDVLICEGTNLNREKDCMSERWVSDNMFSFVNDLKFKYVVVLTSATDIERLASINKAAKKLGRDLYVCSAFMKKTMSIFTRREAKGSRCLFDFHPKFVSFDDAKIPSMRKNGFILATSVTHLAFVEELIEGLDPEKVLLIYSCWDGYYKIPEQITANPRYKEFRVPFDTVADIHTSGHADRKTIRKVVETVKAKEVIFIHKEPDATL